MKRFFKKKCFLDRRKAKYVMFVSFGILMFMVIAYAAISSNLTINGTSKISTTWDIYIESINEGSKYRATTLSKNVVDKSTAQFSTNLEAPGSYMEYVVSVKNASNVDAVLESVTGIDEANQKSPTDIVYSIIGKQGNITLKANESYSFVVRVAFKTTATSIPTTTKSLTLKLNYRQKTASTPQYDPYTEAYAIGEQVEVAGITGLFHVLQPSSAGEKTVKLLYDESIGSGAFSNIPSNVYLDSLVYQKILEYEEMWMANVLAVGGNIDGMAADAPSKKEIEAIRTYYGITGDTTIDNILWLKLNLVSDGERDDAFFTKTSYGSISSGNIWVYSSTGSFNYTNVTANLGYETKPTLVIDKSNLTGFKYR